MFLLYFTFCALYLHNVECLYPVLLNGSINETISVQVNKSIEYIIDYDTIHSKYPVRVYATSLDATKAAPLIVVVRQRKQVLSWQLPMLVDDTMGGQEFMDSGRTLCQANTESNNTFAQLYSETMTGANIDNLYLEEEPIISISSSSTVNITAKVKLTVEEDFFLKPSTMYNISISPSKPKYYFYNFPDNSNNRDNYETVILEIFSDDTICMTVSLQNSSCPVYDLNNDITFEGFFETVGRKGGITISKGKFPYGFFVVFVAKGDDADCSDLPSTNKDRTKYVNFIIKPSITYNDYVNAVFVTLGCIALFYVVFGIGFCVCTHRTYVPRTMEFAPEFEANTPSSIQDFTRQSSLTGLGTINIERKIHTETIFEQENRTVLAINSSKLTLIENGIPDIIHFRFLGASGASEKTLELLYCEGLIKAHCLVKSNPEFNIDNISLDETEYDTIAETEYDRETILSKPIIYLSDLARKDPRILTKKSYSYLWHVLTVALFYLLPVVQLVITYQKVLNDTGNQDLCYYNFLCAHPLGFFSDFNHLFSNVGYILFGFLFLWMTHRRERWHKDPDFDRQYGIPQHYGLFYAIGVALIMEGVLSGSYHICPNQSNFQFDTSFMYVTAVLCCVKLYQTRHPDINATAYATFGVLAVAILLGMFGILESNIYFWIGFTILHILTCFYLTAQIYYMGCCKFDRGLVVRVFRMYVNDFRAGPLNVLKPVYKGRMVLLIIGNLFNWTLAGLGIYAHQKDFALYLLGVFMLNTVYYFTFYIIMKLLHKERINKLTLLFLVLSLSCAVVSMYCFLHKSISWSLTPAGSREFNQECKLMRFYDFHDLWHFLSAVGMFFMFMTLLILDDDLSHVHRTKIHVF